VNLPKSNFVEFFLPALQARSFSERIPLFDLMELDHPTLVSHPPSQGICVIYTPKSVFSSTKKIKIPAVSSPSEKEFHVLP